MGLFDLFKKKKQEDIPSIKTDKTTNCFYQNPENLVEIVFANRTKQTVNIWIELAALPIDLDENTEYKMITHERRFRMEFDKDNQMVFYLEYCFGFKLYKRIISSQGEWMLELDLSDIY